ncbi:MAG TPA: DUF6541 family protein, partial [Roseiflexaceae bacterium]|nr:DUF6541 family protein [Roseiflexaceae bacterium]
AVAWGIGMGMPALLLMLLHLLHLPWPGWMTWVYLGAAALALAWVQVRRSVPAEHTPLAPSRLFAYAMLLGLAVLALLARLFSVHDLVVGPNVDSYHHSLIATLLVERQGLFSDWAPYAPLVTFTYHYAFHALVAWAFHLSGIPIVLLVPLVGQVMNAAMVPMLFALTSVMTRRPIAGVWAALLVGFVNLQPAFYVFWGRGPFVASHSLLVALLICWMAAIEAPRMRPGLLALAAIGSAALAHAHYQTTILAAIFLFSYLLLMVLRAPNVRSARAVVERAALIGTVALVLALPWMWNTFSGHLARNVVYNSDNQSGATFAGLPVAPLIPFGVNAAVMALAVLGFLLAVRLRLWRVALLGSWALLSAVIAYPYVVGLPGTGIIEPSLVAMVLYLTLVPLAGFTLGSFQSALEYVALRWRFGVWAVRATAAVIAILVSVGGLAWQRELVPPYDRMVTSADLHAIEWIRATTRPEARFLVGSHPIYNGLMVAGTDAGWWLPLLAGRQTNVPPLTYGSERMAEPNGAQRISDVVATLRRAPLADTSAHEIDLSSSRSQQVLREEDIRYVYIGSQS